jgi:hypothetical protein
MLYMRFSPTSRNKWEVSTPKSAKPIATVTRRRGRCSATITSGHALNLEELACVSAFMQEREGAPEVLC